jgi:S1-C subfamily serine protease
VSYDREEWRRPWRPTPGQASPSSTASSTGAGSAAPAEPASRTGPAWRPSEPTEGGRRPDDPAERVWRPSEPTEGGRRPDDPAERVWRPSEPTETLTRYPQPPPEGFDADAAGPGSPVGSVRPPDTTGTVDPPRPPRRRGIVAVLIAAVFGAVLGTTATLAVMLPQDVVDEADGVTPGSTDISAPSIEVMGGSNGIVPAVAEAVTPSVVTVDVAAPGANARSSSLGSGVIYRSDGYILTNHHVIEAAIEQELAVTVRLSSGDVLEAEIVGSDELNDLAVLKVDRDGLPAINLRPEDEPLRVGETVVAVGSPFGLDTSVTAGIISALNRELRIDDADGLVIPSVIQTDAAINPGNSGGALVDAEGRLVGINTAILTQSGANQGVGFAVSWEQSVRSADELIEEGFVRHPLLGIAGQDVTPDLADELDLPASRGAVIQEVQPETGAADADLRPGDVIVEFDGDALATMSQLVAEVRRMSPGDQVDLVIIREGERIELSVTLSERPR